ESGQIQEPSALRGNERAAAGAASSWTGSQARHHGYWKADPPSEPEYLATWFAEDPDDPPRGKYLPDSGRHQWWSVDQIVWHEPTLNSRLPGVALIYSILKA